MAGPRGTDQTPEHHLDACYELESGGHRVDKKRQLSPLVHATEWQPLAEPIVLAAPRCNRPFSVFSPLGKQAKGLARTAFISLEAVPALSLASKVLRPRLLPP